MTSSADVPLYHNIECGAGTSNSIILPEAEAQLAKCLLHDAEHDLHILDLQIAQLCEQREQDAARLNRLRIAVAPHKHLPAEILSHIFRLSAGEDEIDIPLRTSPYPPQWVLRQVSSRWRHIVLNDRHLWNNISINLETEDEGWESEYLQRISLDISGFLLPIILPTTGPLTMTVRSNGSRDHAKKVLNVLLEPYGSQIVDLYLCLPGHTFNQFFKTLPSKFTALESLDLEFLDSPSSGTVNELRAFPPSLRKLEITGDISAIWSFGSHEIDWKRLTDINFSDISNGTLFQIHSILQRCINLRTCSITALGTLVGAPPSVHMNLPYLQSLSITMDTGSVFNFFTLPSLECLQVSNRVTKLPVAEITSMVNRSACVLRTLALYGDHPLGALYDPVILDTMFTAMLSLLEFRASIVPPREILEKIGEGSLLPNLEALECDLDAETASVFIEVVERRVRDVPLGGLREALGTYPKDLFDTNEMKGLLVRARNLRRNGRSVRLLASI
ncbi:hypothetical protein Hypma_003514 [Hypsizygus marmoreus]|uniref:F-box domain-containing protein n=1 Tax=Hypsizygus marmoreus TaxID=39966 RepID=A0A369J8C1_HYPMA|nr:hypothetical protein Hypma_003514 [Hypsizygus marmoreus]